MNFVHFKILCSSQIVIVPHSQSGAVPMSPLSGVEQLGLWEVGEDGING